MWEELYSSVPESLPPNLPAGCIFFAEQGGIYKSLISGYLEGDGVRAGSG
jgi:hypothetical protein